MFLYSLTANAVYPNQASVTSFHIISNLEVILQPKHIFLLQYVLYLAYHLSRNVLDCAVYIFNYFSFLQCTFS